MPGNGIEVYRICREQAGYTQESAAERLPCSVRQLARYESGEAPVPDDIAYQMVVLYDSQLLAVQHLRLVSHVAAGDGAGSSPGNDPYHQSGAEIRRASPGAGAAGHRRRRRDLSRGAAAV